MELAYAAGFFDGEGAVMIWRRPRSGKLQHHLYVSIGQVDARPLLWLQERFRGTIVVRPPAVGSKYNLSFQWTLQAKRAGEFLRDIRPYLVLKCERVDLALAFQDTILPWRTAGSQRLAEGVVEQREELRLRLMALNKRGVA